MSSQDIPLPTDILLATNNWPGNRFVGRSRDAPPETPMDLIRRVHAAGRRFFVYNDNHWVYVTNPLPFLTFHKVQRPADNLLQTIYLTPEYSSTETFYQNCYNHDQSNKKNDHKLNTSHQSAETKIPAKIPTSDVQSTKRSRDDVSPVSKTFNNKVAKNNDCAPQLPKVLIAGSASAGPVTAPLGSVKAPVPVNVHGPGKAPAMTTTSIQKTSSNNSATPPTALLNKNKQNNKRDHESSLPRGVTVRPSGKWQAQIYFSGCSRYVGVFDTSRDAAIAYETAKAYLKAQKPYDKDQALKMAAQARKVAHTAVWGSRTIENKSSGVDDVAVSKK
jgi:hypothetical protein